MRSLPCLLSLALGCQAYLAFPPSVYVCPTYPFCALDLKTRAWSSSLTDSQGAPTGTAGNSDILCKTQHFPSVLLPVLCLSLRQRPLLMQAPEKFLAVAALAVLGVAW